MSHQLDSTKPLQPLPEAYWRALWADQASGRRKRPVRTTLSDREVDMVRVAHRCGAPRKAIAAYFGITPEYVGRIVRREVRT